MFLFFSAISVVCPFALLRSYHVFWILVALCRFGPVGKPWWLTSHDLHSVASKLSSGRDHRRVNVVQTIALWSRLTISWYHGGEHCEVARLFPHECFQEQSVQIDERDSRTLLQADYADRWCSLSSDCRRNHGDGENLPSGALSPLHEGTKEEIIEAARFVTQDFHHCTVKEMVIMDTTQRRTNERVGQQKVDVPVPHMKHIHEAIMDIPQERASCEHFPTITLLLSGYCSRTWIIMFSACGRKRSLKTCLCSLMSSFNNAQWRRLWVLRPRSRSWQLSKFTRKKPRCDRRSALRESLVEAWDIDIREVGASEVSFLS